MRRMKNQMKRSLSTHKNAETHPCYELTGVSWSKNRRHLINRKETLEEQLWTHQWYREKRKEKKRNEGDAAQLTDRKETGQAHGYWLVPHWAEESRTPWNILFGGPKQVQSLWYGISLSHFKHPVNRRPGRKDILLSLLGLVQQECCRHREGTWAPEENNLSFLATQVKASHPLFGEKDWDWPIHHSHVR